MFLIFFDINWTKNGIRFVGKANVMQFVLLATAAATEKAFQVEVNKI